MNTPIVSLFMPLTKIICTKCADNTLHAPNAEIVFLRVMAVTKGIRRDDEY